MQELFSTSAKRTQLLSFAHVPLIEHLHATSLAAATDLGDATKETAEELAEREARAAAQSVTALRRLLLAAIAANDDAVLAALESVWSDDSFWERGLQLQGSLGPALRSAAYLLLVALAVKQPEAVQRRVDLLAPRALAAVSYTHLTLPTKA